MSVTHRLLMSAALILGGTAAMAGDPPTHPWPGFRGHDGRATVSSPTVLRSLRRPGLKVRWTAPLGSGYSGTAVVGRHLATMYTDGKDDFTAVYDVTDGKQLWKHRVSPMYVGHDGSHDGPISTPAIADGRVFALATTGVLFAYDLTTGSVLWQVDLVGDMQAPGDFYGFAPSPMVVEGTLVLHVGGTNQALVGFDPATGAKRWAVVDDKVGYQSPVLFQHAGKTAVLAASQKMFFAVNPADGTLHWSFAHEGGGGRGAGSLVPVPTDSGFFLSHKNDLSRMVTVTEADGATTLNTPWENRNIRNSYNVPVYHDGYLYAFSSRFLTCVRASDGESMWRTREPGDGFLILVDGMLFVQTKQGSVHLAEATPEGYRERAMLPGEVLSWTPPAFADNTLYVRNMQQLTAVDLVEGTEVAADRHEQAGDGAFGAFCAAVDKAEDKAAVVDAYLAAQKRLPVVEGDKVHFLYRGAAEDVALGGDMFGARQERPMTRLAGTDVFYYSMTLPRDALVAYVFIKDFQEHLTDPGNPERYDSSLVTKDMEMNWRGKGLTMSLLKMPEWTPSPALQDGQAPAGTLEKHSLASKALDKSVEVTLRLPAGYDKAHRYPVAVVHSPDVLTYGQWEKQLDNLQAGTTRPFLTVFVPTPNPYDDDAHIRFVADELIPWLDTTFATVAEPAARVSLGVSDNGVTAIKCALRRADVFGGAGSVSGMFFGSAMVPFHQTLAELKQPERLTVYMNWGSMDYRNPKEAWNMTEANRETAAALKAKGIKVLEEEFAGGTDWYAWSHRSAPMLTAFFGTDTGKAGAPPSR